MLSRYRYVGHTAIGTLATVLFDYKLKSPVFVIGTGRCGTSLLVKILNSHTKLRGFPGEANEFWHPKSYPFRKRSIETPTIVENPKQFTDLSIKNWSDNHAKKIQRTFIGYYLTGSLEKTFFVKSAMISFMIPQLLSMFPDAKFIHIYRNGPSVVESFLKKEWNKYHNYFDSKQEHLFYCSKYWNDCLLEIEKQKRKLSLEKKGALLEFSYEELCENPTKTLNNIAKFLSISLEEFNFDTTQIVSQNYKIGDYTKDEKWLELLELMSRGMALKGYS